MLNVRGVKSWIAACPPKMKDECPHREMPLPKVVEYSTSIMMYYLRLINLKCHIEFLAGGC